MALTPPTTNATAAPDSDAHKQAGYDVRFEWGASGVTALGSDVAVVVIVDILRFTTAVEAAVSQGTVVYPYDPRNGSAETFAASVGAVLADGATPPGRSLSPISLLSLSAGDAVVLPSPNGSRCATLAAKPSVTVVAACLRNAGAVADWLRHRPRPLLVIAAGETWPDGSLRPAVEDMVGAGAIIDAVGGSASPEATMAGRAWRAVKRDPWQLLSTCSSGRELIAIRRVEDVRYAAESNVSTVVPVLIGGAFVAEGVRMDTPASASDQVLDAQ